MRQNKYWLPKTGILTPCFVIRKRVVVNLNSLALKIHILAIKNNPHTQNQIVYK